MTSISQDISLWQGEETAVTITVLNPADVEITLTNGALRWVMWHPLKGVVLTKTSNTTAPNPGGITLNDQMTNTGECVLTFVKADTATLAPLTYWHALSYEPLNGDFDVVTDGNLTLSASRGLQV